MKVVIAHRSRQPRVVDLPEPNCGRGFITVRVSHSAVVLPDELYAIDRAPTVMKKGDDGLPIGCHASGVIMEVGEDVRSLKAGLRVGVTGAPYVYHGGYLVVPENLAIELPKKVNHEEGAFSGLGAIALHLLRTGNVQLGETVLVFGADMLGLLASQLVRAAGATPILIDDSEFRLNRARTLGIAHAFLPNDDQIVRNVESLTEGQGADVALLTRSADEVACPLAAQFLRPGGIIIAGVSIGASLPVDDLRAKALQLRTAFGGGTGAGDAEFERRSASFPRSLTRWTEKENMACFANLLAERKVQVSPLITDRIPIERASAIYEKAARGRDAVLGAVLTY